MHRLNKSLAIINIECNYILNVSVESVSRSPTLKGKFVFPDEAKEINKIIILKIK